MTVESYWEEKYGKLQYPHLPCVDVSKGKKLQYLPLEVVEIAPGQRAQRISDEQKRSMIRASACRPSERMNLIMSAFNEANIQNDPSAQTLGIRLGNEMMQVFPAVEVSSIHRY